MSTKNQKRYHKTTPRVKLVNSDFLKFYEEKGGYKRDRKLISKIAKEIWKVTASNLLERKGGVLLDRLGYLCHWMTPSRKSYKMMRKGKLITGTNYQTDGYWYNTSLFTDVFPSTKFRGWTLDRAFARPIKRGRFYQQQKGMKYKCYYTLVRGMYSNRDIK